MRRVLPFAVLIAAGALAACNNNNDLPGRGYMPTGETTVSQSVPLTVPPNFGLRPEPEIEATDSTVIAQQQITVVDTALATGTAGEQSLLTRSGVQQADPGIRDVLNRENALLADDPELTEALLFGDYPKGTTTGEPAPDQVTITEGSEVDTDVAIEQGEPVEDTSWLDDMFDIF